MTTGNIVKLKNQYNTSDVVYCNNIKDIKMRCGIPFVEVYTKEKPERTYLVNLDVYRVVK